MCIVKKVLSVLLVVALLLPVLVLKGSGKVQATGTTYYVSYSTGDDNNDGTIGAPWKTLTKVGLGSYTAGDHILLKCGDTWNEELTISNSSGTSTNPILISSYGTGNKPKIARNLQQSDKCIKINSASGFKITNLEIADAAFGIVLYYNYSFNNSYIWIENCSFSNIYGVHSSTPYEVEPEYGISAAIKVSGYYGLTETRVCVDDVTIKNCTSDGCATFFSNTFDRDPTSGAQVTNLKVENCTVTNGKYFGINIGWVTGGHIDNSKFLNNGQWASSSGTTSILLRRTRNFTVRNTEIAYHQRQSTDPDGCGLDFEGTNDDIVIDNCDIHDNDGVGVFYFGKGGASPDNNCSVRNTRFYGNGADPDPHKGIYNIYFSQPTAATGGELRDNKYIGVLCNDAYKKPSSVTVSGNESFALTKAWEYISSDEGWTTPGHVTGFVYGTGGYISGTISGSDPRIASQDNLGISLTNAKYIDVRYKNSSSSTTGKFYFKTGSDTSFTESKAESFTAIANDPDYTIYTIDMSTVPGWTGTLKQLRFDPSNVSSGSFSVDYIRVRSQYTSDPSSYGWTRVDDTDASVTYTGSNWITGSHAFDYLDNMQKSNKAGEYAEYTFTGTKVRWGGRMSSSGGIAKVYIDDMTTPVVIVDLYSPTITYQQVLFESAPLASGTHTIRITAMGTQNTLSSDSNVIVDFFDYTQDVWTRVDEDNTSITYTGSNWITGSNVSDYNDDILKSDTAGEYAEYTFTGTRVNWGARRSTAAGIAEVYIDNMTIPVKTIDLYAVADNYQRIPFESDTLAPGTHTIRVKATGINNASSSDSNVIVDFFEYR